MDQNQLGSGVSLRECSGNPTQWSHSIFELLLTITGRWQFQSWKGEPLVPTDLCWPPREIGESQQEGEESRRVDKAAPELEQVIDGQGVSQEGLSGRPWTGPEEQSLSGGGQAPAVETTQPSRRAAEGSDGKGLLDFTLSQEGSPRAE